MNPFRRGPRPVLPPSRRPHRLASSGATDPDSARYIAMHQAGHAVATVVLGMPLSSVGIQYRTTPVQSVALRSAGSGDAGQAIVGKGADWLVPLMVQAMTAIAAEQQWNRAPRNDAADAELLALHGLSTLALHGTNDVAREIERLSAEASLKTREIITDRFPAIVQIAGLLIDRHELTGDEIRAVVGV